MRIDLLIGHAQAIDETRLQPRVAHALGDRLAAAVDEHGIDADRFEKDDIAQEPLDDLLILHRAAAVFDDEKLAAKFLDVGQRLDERFGALTGLGEIGADGRVMVEESEGSASASNRRPQPPHSPMFSFT